MKGKPTCPHPPREPKSMESENERLRNQKEFKELVKKYGLTNKQAAELIEKQTNQKIGERKLRTWLADPTLLSSRTMPNWAITGLKEATKKLQENKSNET